MNYGNDLETRITKLWDRMAKGVPAGGMISDGKEFARLTRKYPQSNDADLGRPGTLTDHRLAYFAERERGVEHVWAVMTASRKGPALNTDTTLFAGVPRLAEQIGNKEHLQAIIASAKAQGYTPNPNDIYHGGIAQFVGDRDAFIPRDGARGHIKRLLERKNLPCVGAISRTIEDRGGGEIPSGRHLDPGIAERIAREKGILNASTEKDKAGILQDMTRDHGVSSDNLMGPVQPETVNVVKPSITSANLPKKKTASRKGK